MIYLVFFFNVFNTNINMLRTKNITRIVNIIRLNYKGNIACELSHFPIINHALIVTGNLNVHVGTHYIKLTTNIYL